MLLHFHFHFHLHIPHVHFRQLSFRSILLRTPRTPFNMSDMNQNRSNVPADGAGSVGIPGPHNTFVYSYLSS